MTEPNSTPPKGTALVKTPQQTPMRAPSHGRGQLRQGGTNRGGPGRPKNALRAAMRESLEARLPVAEGIVDDETASYADRLKALDFLARYGLGTQEEVDTTGAGPLVIHVRRDPD